MTERQGEPDQWRWGALHTATFRNDTLGKSGVSLIENIFNRGPYETAGSKISVNATGGSAEGDNPFELDWLPSERMIVDMADLDRSLTINTTGQSGHPYHKHYDDQIDRWRLIEYAPMHWSREQLEGASEGVLTLTP